MADLGVFVAYLLSFGIPGAIYAISNAMDSPQAGAILAYVNFVGLTSYFIYMEKIDSWVLVVGLILISLLFTVLYKGILGDSSE
jgi:hypothetical protein